MNPMWNPMTWSRRDLSEVTILLGFLWLQSFIYNCPRIGLIFLVPAAIAATRNLWLFRQFLLGKSDL